MLENRRAEKRAPNERGAKIGDRRGYLDSLRLGDKRRGGGMIKAAGRDQRDGALVIRCVRVVVKSFMQLRRDREYEREGKGDGGKPPADPRASLSHHCGSIVCRTCGDRNREDANSFGVEAERAAASGENEEPAVMRSTPARRTVTARFG